MGRPLEHGTDTGTALLAAAEAILAEKGIDAISVRQVAGEVGVTTRAVYTVFGGKEGLLAALASRGHEVLRQRLVECDFQQDSINDLVNIGFNGFRNFALSHPHLYRLSFERTPPNLATHTKVLEASRPGLKLLIEHFKRAQEKGFIKAGDPKRLALTFHALCVGLSNWELSLSPSPTGSGMGILVPSTEIEQIWMDSLSELLSGFSKK